MGDVPHEEEASHSKRLTLLAVSLLLLAAGALWLLGGGQEAPLGAEGEQSSAGTEAPPPAAEPAPLAPASRPNSQVGLARSPEAETPSAHQPPATPQPRNSAETSASAHLPIRNTDGRQNPGTGKADPFTNKDSVRAAIKHLLPLVKDCYAQGLKTDPSMEGMIQVKVLLKNAPDGGAFAQEGEIGEASTLQAPLVQACILSKLQTAHFPELKDYQGAKGGGGLRVTYPFKLQQNAGGFGGDEGE